MKRHQLALILAMCQITLGDRFIKLELDRLYRGMPLMYKRHIEKKIKDVDLRDSQEVVRDIVSYIVNTYMKRKNGFLSGFASNKPPKETALIVHDWIIQLNLPVPKDLKDLVALLNKQIQN